jgi:hypothetical protein
MVAISSSAGPTLPAELTGATRDQVARQVAGSTGIEVKATIPGDQVDAALYRFNLTVDNDQERYIYFFDTPDLELLKAGIITRARRIVGDQHDSTVKFRPVVPSNIPPEWSKLKGFKLEADASEKGVVRSASLTLPVEKGLIKRVVAKRTFWSPWEASRFLSTNSRYSGLWKRTAGS